jgi:hypothetical protein
MPHPGMPQIIITESMIKSIIKKSLKASFAVIVSMIIKELTEATSNKDVVKILAVGFLIKGIFGSDIGKISGNDIKSFVLNSLNMVNDALSELETFLKAPPSIDFKSIKQTLFPGIPKFSDKGPFLEIGTKDMLRIATPLLTTLQNVSIPFPVVLLGCSVTPSRIALTKIHPFSSKEMMPSWDKLSLKNVPFVIWLDQLIATAQRQGGICSDYVAPYYMPDI